MRQRLPCGSWPSPVSAASVAAQSVAIGGVAVDGDAIYWSESRPGEGGRITILRWDGASLNEILPAPYGARSRVHEYGGGAFAVADGVLYFSSDSDNGLYRLEPGGAPRRLVQDSDVRYADLWIDRGRGRLVAVREMARTGAEPANALVSMDAATGSGGCELMSDHDFCASPVMAPDGQTLAWLAWNHPNMPWDGAELWVARLDAAGGIVERVRVAGGERESVFQPRFGADGTLYFVSDRSGWWNLHRFRDGRTEPLWPREAEFGLPQWVFGMSTYALLGERRLVAAFRDRGRTRLGMLDIGSGTTEIVEVPDTEIGGVQATSSGVVYVGASPSAPNAVIHLDLAGRRRAVVSAAPAPSPDPDDISVALPLSFETAQGEHAHGFFYAPTNAKCVAGPGERPPLLVMSHGGPTAATSSAWNPKVQFWTSRGFAVLDVDYRGSTGYGRAYREKLNGRWGIADVEDCVAGARHVAGLGWVDPARMAIRGSSAGGFTTLCALTYFDVFRAGACYYGIGDLETLVRDTHKFESRYLDRLVGPYPEARETYRARSPIHHIDRLNCPVIFFQGLDDRVVPPNQTEGMVEALRNKGLPVAYLAFEGEGHGFRRGDTVRRALEAELSFYATLFGFVPADELAPVQIENLGK